jgi:hypothetical protein
MTDYQIQPNTRHCAATGRELRPGDRYYSVLLEEGGKFVRKDYSADAWQGAPTGAFSFWQGRIVGGQAPKRPPIDDDLLLDCFQRLEGETGQARVNFRYVLSLLLLRRRRFRLEDGGRDTLVFRCARTGARHQVLDPKLSDEEIEAVQDDVFQALGWE